jgi:hypothetical protein
VRSGLVDTPMAQTLLTARDYSLRPWRSAGSYTLDQSVNITDK